MSNNYRIILAQAERNDGRRAASELQTEAPADDEHRVLATKHVRAGSGSILASL